MSRFAGRTALVTGASRGLGRALALAFAAEGAFVFVGCRVRVGEAEDVLAEIRAAGADGTVVAFDVRDAGATTAAVERMERERGAIDVLVANAGVTSGGPFATAGADEWDDVVAVDLQGVAHVVRAVARGMLARGRGSIVAVGSVAGIRGVPGQSAYATAKGGLLAFVRSVSVELAPRGVRLNAVVPGVIDVGMTHRTPRPIVDRWVGAVPVGRLGRTDEVAAAVLFLASDEAGYIVGQALVVDGGLSV